MRGKDFFFGGMRPDATPRSRLHAESSQVDFTNDSLHGSVAADCGPGPQSIAEVSWRLSFGVPPNGPGVNCSRTPTTTQRYLPNHMASYRSRTPRLSGGAGGVRARARGA
eukprot:5411346-Prymnesium_polylepis.2